MNHLKKKTKLCFIAWKKVSAESSPAFKNTGSVQSETGTRTSKNVLESESETFKTYLTLQRHQYVGCVNNPMRSQTSCTLAEADLFVDMRLFPKGRRPIWTCRRPLQVQVLEMWVFGFTPGAENWVKAGVPERGRGSNPSWGDLFGRVAGSSASVVFYRAPARWAPVGLHPHTECTQWRSPGWTDEWSRSRLQEGEGCLSRRRNPGTIRTSAVRVLTGCKGQEKYPWNLFQYLFLSTAPIIWTEPTRDV